MHSKIFIFGYGKHGKSIARGLLQEGHRVTIIESNEKQYEDAKEDGFIDCLLMDVTQDSKLEALMVEKGDQLICVMDDEHLNVFLTLSLRPLFPESTLLAISDSIHASQKLQMAGADCVIDLYDSAANRIHNLLKRPTVTRFLLYDSAANRIHNLLKRPTVTRFLDSVFEGKGGIVFREIVIPRGSFMDGMLVDDIDFSLHKVLLIGMVDFELGEHFVFITSGEEHRIDHGDHIVCLGLDEDLDKFETLIMGEGELL